MSHLAMASIKDETELQCPAVTVTHITAAFDQLFCAQPASYLGQDLKHIILIFLVIKGW